MSAVERRAGHQIESSRAGGLHRALSRCSTSAASSSGSSPRARRCRVKIVRQVRAGHRRHPPRRHNYGLALWQSDFEHIYSGRPGRQRRRDDPARACRDGVRAGRRRRRRHPLRRHRRCTRCLVGCDGRRNLILQEGGRYRVPVLRPDDQLDDRRGRDAGGHAARHIEASLAAVACRRSTAWRTGRTVRAVLTESAEVVGQLEPTLHDLSASLIAVYGTDFGAHSPKWISCSSPTYWPRPRRPPTEADLCCSPVTAPPTCAIPPQGGRDLSTSACRTPSNLEDGSWPRVVHGTSPDALLDTYHAERHPVAARVLRNTMAQVAVSRTDERTAALRDTLAELLALDEPRQLIGGMLSGLDIHYDLGPGHPLLGRRMPDLDLVAAPDGPCGSSTCCTAPSPCCCISPDRTTSTVTRRGPARVQLVHAAYSRFVGASRPRRRRERPPPSWSGRTGTSLGSAISATPGSPMR